MEQRKRRTGLSLRDVQSKRDETIQKKSEKKSFADVFSLLSSQTRFSLSLPPYPPRAQLKMQTVSLSRSAIAPLSTRKASSAASRRAVVANAADKPLWFPGAEARPYLAGLPGDRGFDPAVRALNSDIEYEAAFRILPFYAKRGRQDAL